ncbi:hypothetical protein K7432_007334 [Basidiobolus ranarum]
MQSSSCNKKREHTAAQTTLTTQKAKVHKKLEKVAEDRYNLCNETVSSNSSSNPVNGNNVTDGERFTGSSGCPSDSQEQTMQNSNMVAMSIAEPSKRLLFINREKNVRDLPESPRSPTGIDNQPMTRVPWEPQTLHDVYTPETPVPSTSSNTTIPTTVHDVEPLPQDSAHVNEVIDLTPNTPSWRPRANAQTRSQVITIESDEEPEVRPSPLTFAPTAQNVPSRNPSQGTRGSRRPNPRRRRSPRYDFLNSVYSDFRFIHAFENLFGRNLMRMESNLPTPETFHLFHGGEEEFNRSPTPPRPVERPRPTKVPDNLMKLEGKGYSVNVPTEQDGLIVCAKCEERPQSMHATGCGHVFCEECISQVMEAKKCPCCNKRLKPKDVIKLFI